MVLLLLFSISTVFCFQLCLHLRRPRLPFVIEFCSFYFQYLPSFVSNCACLCGDLGCLLLSSFAPFIFNIYRLLFPTVPAFAATSAAFCYRVLLLLFSISTVFCFQLCLPTLRSRLPTYYFVLERGQTIEVGFQSRWVPRLCTPLLSCRLTRLNFNSFSFCFDRRCVLFFRPLPIVCGQHIFLLLTVFEQ